MISNAEESISPYRPQVSNTRLASQFSKGRHDLFRALCTGSRGRQREHPSRKPHSELLSLPSNQDFFLTDELLEGLKNDGVADKQFVEPFPRMRDPLMLTVHLLFQAFKFLAWNTPPPAIRPRFVFFLQSSS